MILVSNFGFSDVGNTMVSSENAYNTVLNAEIQDGRHPKSVFYKNMYNLWKNHDRWMILTSNLGFLGTVNTMVSSKNANNTVLLLKYKMAFIQGPSFMKTCIIYERNLIDE